MSRRGVIALLALVGVGPTARVHGQTPDVPPIPERERFIGSDDLTVTLRLVSDRVQIDELPRGKVVFKNTGTKRLLIRKPSQDVIDSNPSVAVYTESGVRLYPGLTSSCRCIPMLGRLRDLMVVLEPQQEYETELIVPHVTLPGFQSWELVVNAGGLRPGDYVVRATYTNAPDTGGRYYDVYEAGGDRAWEGQIETAPVRFSVVPPSEGRLQELIAAIDGTGNADGAIRVVGVARASQAADALVRRLQRQPPGMFGGTTWQSGLLALAALGAIGDSEANSRLLTWIDTLSPQESSRIGSGLWITDALRPLMRTASGCSGRTAAAWNGGDGVRELVARCSRLADEARTAVRAPYDPTRPGSLWEAKSGSIQLLGRLGDPVDVPLLLSVARGEEPALERGPVGVPVPSQALMNQAVSWIRQIASAHIRRVVTESSADPLPDGSSRNDFLAQVRAGLDRIPVDRFLTLIPELLAATPPDLMNRAVALRHVDAPAPPAPAPPVAPTSVASGNVTKQTFDELALVELVVSADGEVRQSAYEALSRFGTASAFIPLRNGLVLRPKEVAMEVDRTLRNLTFTGYVWSKIADLEAWDAWWRRNRGLTRRQWAEQALIDARPDPTSRSTEKAEQALEYLADSPDPPGRCAAAAVPNHCRDGASGGPCHWQSSISQRHCAWRDCLPGACSASAPLPIRG
jgi:hypothetical protein